MTPKKQRGTLHTLFLLGVYVMLRFWIVNAALALLLAFVAGYWLGGTKCQ